MAMMKSTRGLGIGHKMLMAFAAMFLATVATGITAGVYQFQIATLFGQVQKRDFPLATGALKLADQSASLTEAARTLARADQRQTSGQRLDSLDLQPRAPAHRIDRDVDTAP